MFCWGKSSEGQLGLGDIGDEPVLSPKKVEDTFGSVSEIKDIVCGWEHTAVLKQDGVVYTCGNNENGQLGHHKEGKKLGKTHLLNITFASVDVYQCTISVLLISSCYFA